MRPKLYQQYQSDVAAQWFSHFLLKPFVRRVKRRGPMRKLRLDRSTNRSANAFGIGVTHDWDYLHGLYFGGAVPFLAPLRVPINLDEFGEVAAVMQRIPDGRFVRSKGRAYHGRQDP